MDGRQLFVLVSVAEDGRPLAAVSSEEAARLEAACMFDDDASTGRIESASCPEEEQLSGLLQLTSRLLLAVAGGQKAKRPPKSHGKVKHRPGGDIPGRASPLTAPADESKRSRKPNPRFAEHGAPR